MYAQQPIAPTMPNKNRQPYPAAVSPVFLSRIIIGHKQDEPAQEVLYRGAVDLLGLCVDECQSATYFTTQSFDTRRSESLTCRDSRVWHTRFITAFDVGIHHYQVCLSVALPDQVVEVFIRHAEGVA